MTPSSMAPLTSRRPAPAPPPPVTSHYRLRPGAPRAAGALLDAAATCTLWPCAPPPPCSRAADTQSPHWWLGALLKPVAIGVVVFDSGGGKAGGEKRELARHRP
ncbi:Os11g0152275 [Oryza sativa Japonica Group]|uniref:Os11g0152275 protein n=1 Tax=Oryza sativa subsp. japonica TaxID=39947 RepID=A0A0P0XYV4_ORYSJ|nr:Os11g0152275 [Oryza sativa Japonica Group]